MRATGIIRAELVDRRTVLSRVRSDPPLLLRSAAGRVLLVGGAAGPLGGDELELRVEVGAGARLRLGSVAASIALPGPGPSSLTVDVTVGPGAELVWSPEALVSATGSHHVQRVRIALADGAVLRWRDAVVLGRSGEEPGRLALDTRVELGERVLLHQEVVLGPADGSESWMNPSLLGGARAMVGELAVGGEPAGPPAGSPSDPQATVADLGRGARLAVSLGDDLTDAERRLTAIGKPDWFAVSSDPRCRR